MNILPIDQPSSPVFGGGGRPFPPASEPWPIMLDARAEPCGRLLLRQGGRRPAPDVRVTHVAGECELGGHRTAFRRAAVCMPHNIISQFKCAISPNWAYPWRGLGGATPNVYRRGAQRPDSGFPWRSPRWARMQELPIVSLAANRCAISAELPGMAYEAPAKGREPLSAYPRVRN